MTEDPARLDPEQLARAERLDAEVAAALAGAPPRDADPAALWLATAMRAGVPAGLRGRVADAVLAPARRAWGWVRLCAAALALLLVAQAAGAIFAGEWIAEELGEPFSEHAFYEGGLALLGVALALAAGALRRAWAPVAVAVGAPLGLALGVDGFAELGEFAAGAALHLAQGALAIGLLGAWWRARRYGSAPEPEEGV